MISWVRVDAGIADDAKIAQIADRLYPRRRRRQDDTDEEAAVVGHLVKLWAKMAAHAKDGALADIPDRLLEKWAGWHGETGRFAAAVRAMMCDEAGRMAAWEKHNGAAIRRAETGAERKRLWREAKERERHAGRDADATQDVPPPPRTVARVDETRRDETDVLPVDKPSLSLAKTADRTETLRAGLREVIPEPYRDAFDGALRSLRGDAFAWLSMLRGLMPGGIDGTEYTGAEIGKALQDCRANGWRPQRATLADLCRKMRTPDPEPERNGRGRARAPADRTTSRELVERMGLGKPGGV